MKYQIIRSGGKTFLVKGNYEKCYYWHKPFWIENGIGKAKNQKQLEKAYQKTLKTK